MSHAKGFLALVNEAKKRIKETTVDEVWSWFQNGESFIFVDVREDEEWNAGHAEKAIHLGKGVIERDIEEEIPDRNAKIVLYCGGGFRSALAADNLQKMGYTDVWSMDGGFKAWKQKGLP